MNNIIALCRNNPKKICRMFFFLNTQADSSKAKSGKKTETLDVKNAFKKKRENNANDEPAPKKAKVESKEAKKGTSPPDANKSKNEPKLNKTDTNLDEIDFVCAKSNGEGKKYNLKICTWNVSGLRAMIKVRLSVLLDILLIEFLTNTAYRHLIRKTGWIMLPKKTQI